MARFRRALCLALSLGVAACATLPLAEPPDISIAGLTLGQSGPFANKLWVDLRLANPNAFEIAIERLDFDLEINQRHLASGGLVQEVDLPGREEIFVPVLMTIRTDDVVATMLNLGSEQRLAYRMSGEAEIDRIPGQTVAFQRRGQLALPEIAGTTSAGS
jgi:LEA14-like dessication related protein